MGDFLDDYLDGLSSGQRFNPLPYGPYHGTKDKRQWHLLADGEREQAIFEARMREEEQSASAEGATAEGGSAPVPEKLILDRRFIVPSVEEIIAAATTPPVTQEAYSQVVDINSYETYGDLIDYETGEVVQVLPSLFNPDQEYTITPVTDTASLVEADPVFDEDRYDMNAPPGEDSLEWQANETITSIGSTSPTSVMLVGAHPDTVVNYGGYSYPGSGITNMDTGLIYPIVAIGGDYAVQFRFVNIDNPPYPLSESFVYPQVDATGSGGNMIYWWAWEGDGMSQPYSIFEIYLDPFLTAAQTLEKLKYEYENFYQNANNGDALFSLYTAQQSGLTDVMAWTYSVIKIV